MIKAGERAPEFTLPDETGTDRSLTELLSTGAIVLYFYPADPSHPEGKLRLLYECAPLGFVVEKAGGRVSTGTEPILEIRAKTIHARCPLVIGSVEDVEEYEHFSSGPMRRAQSHL